MAVLAVTNSTLLDVARATGPDGAILEVAEMLQKRTPFMDDMVWAEGNTQTGWVGSIRSGLPTPKYRKINEGVVPTKSERVKIEMTCGVLEDYSQVDVELAAITGDAAKFRMSEDKAHMMGLRHTIQDALLYKNEDTEPEAITGFAPLYNSLSAENGDNIIDAGGTGSDNASIWLVTWSEETIFGTFPKGTQAGLLTKDLGEVTLDNVNGVTNAKMQAFLTHYKWRHGLVVRDWRYAVRIANIDKSDLSIRFNTGVFVASDGTTPQGADLTSLMYEAIRANEDVSAGNSVFYMSKDIQTKLGQQQQAKTQGSTLKMEDVGGRLTETFQGIPIRQVDAMAADEARVT